jgi:hypothetical protein
VETGRSGHPTGLFRDSTKNLEQQAVRGALAFVLRTRSGLRPLTGPIPGYFVRSIPAARCLLAGQAELAPGARRQRRCPASTIDRRNDPGHLLARNHDTHLADAAVPPAHC